MVMLIGLGEMKGETTLKHVSKMKFKRKAIISDRDLSVILFIPVSQEEFEEEKAQTHISLEETIPEESKVLELYLVEPLIEKLTKIAFKATRDIIIPARVKPYNYVFPIRDSLSFHKPAKVVKLSIEKSIQHTLTTISNMLKDLKKSIPLVVFEVPETIKTTNIVKTVKIEIEPSVKALNYIASPRLVFRKPYKIRYMKVDKEVKVKTSSLLSLTTSTKTMLEEVSTEEKDVLEYFFNATLPRVIVDRPYLILARKPQNERYDYIEFLKRLLRELYRVHAGGLPRPLDLRTDFEEVKLDVKAGKHIYVIDIDYAIDVDKILVEQNKKDKEKVITRYITDRLRELYSQGLGFLVLYGSEKNLDIIKNLGIDNTLSLIHI